MFDPNVSRKLENIMISLQYHSFSFLLSKHSLYFPLYAKTIGYIAFFISELAKRERFTLRMCVLSKKCSTNIDFILIIEANFMSNFCMLFFFLFSISCVPFYPNKYLEIHSCQGHLGAPQFASLIKMKPTFVLHFLINTHFLW